MWCKVYCLSHCSVLINDVDTPLHGLEGRKEWKVDRICDANDAGSV